MGIRILQVSESSRVPQKFRGNVQIRHRLAEGAHSSQKNTEDLIGYDSTTKYSARLAVELKSWR